MLEVNEDGVCLTRPCLGRNRLKGEPSRATNLWHEIPRKEETKVGECNSRVAQEGGS